MRAAQSASSSGATSKTTEDAEVDSERRREARMEWYACIKLLRFPLGGPMYTIGNKESRVRVKRV